MTPNKPVDAIRPLQFVKVLSWSILLLILGFNLGLSVIISNYADSTLLEKQKEFSLLLAENLSHQIYTRFTVPALIRYGRIRLRNEEQAAQLDKVVRSTVHSFNVLEVRLYSPDRVVSYATEMSLVGEETLDDPALNAALDEGLNSFNMESSLSKAAALVSFNMEPGTVLLRTYHPMRSERDLVSGEGPLMGVLEFTQDITAEYTKVVNFERLVVASSLLTSMLLFYVIMVVLRRADRLNQMRLAEREKLERELMQQEKLAGMGRMVAGVAHEIRNPLGIISSTSEHLLKKAKTDGSDSRVRLLSAIHEESKRLGRVVTDFLDYARPKQPQMRPVNVDRVLEQVTVFLENECRQRGIAIERDVQPELTVQGDKDLLYRAFYNIVTNAIQAMDGPGSITIKAAHEVDVVHITIMDTGPGFPPEHIERLKDPFFTTKDTGTGLGLAIVTSIIEGHGADWSLSCGVDGGARVDIIFPDQYEETQS